MGLIRQAINSLNCFFTVLRSVSFLSGIKMLKGNGSGNSKILCLIFLLVNYNLYMRLCSREAVISVEKLTIGSKQETSISTHCIHTTSSLNRN